MKNRRAIAVLSGIAIVCCAMAGCSARVEDGADLLCHRVSFGALDAADWILFSADGRWQTSDRRMGRYSESGAKFVMFDPTGKAELGRAELESGLMTAEIDGEARTYAESLDAARRADASAEIYNAIRRAGYVGSFADLRAALASGAAHARVSDSGYAGNESDWAKVMLENSGGVPFAKDGALRVGNMNSGIANVDRVEKISEDASFVAYSVFRSDGSTFEVKAEKIRSPGKAVCDYSLDELFAFMQTNGYAGTYEDFARFVARAGSSVNVGRMLMSSVSIIAGTRANSGVSAGSGVFFRLDKERGDAYVITNFHVTYDESRRVFFDEIRAYLYGGEIQRSPALETQDMGMPAECIGGSSVNDIAVLRLSGNPILRESFAESVAVGDSSSIRVHDPCTAVGNTEGDGISVTDGIVSVKSENILMPSILTSDTVSRRVIRMSAPVSPGNSGGGLFDSSGAMIGVVSAKMTRENADNIGYAIPSEVAVGVAENIISQYESDPSGAPHLFARPYVGVTVNVRSSKAELDSTGMPFIREDIVVNRVEPTGLCSGVLRKGDLFVSVAVNAGPERPVVGLHSLSDAVMFAKVGDTVRFDILRDGKRLAPSVVIDASCVKRE